MVRLIINNSISKIEGLNTEQYKALREILSYRIADAQIYWGGSHRPSKRYLLDRRGNFPTGLYRYVTHYLLNASIRHDLVDHRPLPSRTQYFDLKLDFTPYQEQLDAVSEAVYAGRGMIVSPTGTGKSAIIALLINEFKLRTLIVVPSLELKRQLSESLLEAFGKLDNITVQNVDALDPDEPAKYDMLICDEAHHTAANTYRKLNQKAWSGIYHRFFLTATPFRSKDEEQLLMESVSGQVIYRLSHKTAVEKGYIVPIEAYYYDLPRTQVTGNTWAAVYSQLVVKNDYRNRIITEVLNQLHKAGASTLCLVKEIAHGNKLALDLGAGFANGSNNDTGSLIKWFSSGKLMTLIGTTGVVGEGVDTKACEYVVLAGLGKSKPAFMQQVGRGVRRYPGKESCKVILFRDCSHKWTKSHFAAQVRYLREEYGVEPMPLTLPEV